MVSKRATIHEATIHEVKDANVPPRLKTIIACWAEIGRSAQRVENACCSSEPRVRSFGRIGFNNAYNKQAPLKSTTSYLAEVRKGFVLFLNGGLFP